MAAAFESLGDMYDVALKPRLLHTLMTEDVPDEKGPLDSSKLSRVVSVIKTHKLLSECFSETMEEKQIKRWKSAVEDWLNRLISLLDSINMPDKCWAGICLLGVTSQECSPERFSASYMAWFDKLLSTMQSSGDSQFLMVASCASMSDLITRLAGFPKLKKDGTSCAGKLIQPLLNMLKEDSTDTVQERALHLLCTIITSFPASLPRYYDSVEAAIATKILSGNGSLNLLKKLAYCLALLPKSKGDEDSWLSLLRRILMLSNGFLTDGLRGFEDKSKQDEAVRLMFLPGKETPKTIWGHTLVEEVSGKEKRMSKLSPALLLMSSCSTMLTSSYPVQVNVPVRSLLALVERVLMVHGTLSDSMSSFVIAAEQEYVCSELPVLHSYGLDLLSALIKGMRSQLLPHAAYIVRLVKEYFRRCHLPDLRKKVYSISQMLLISMGVGIADYLAQEVVNNALVDLHSVAHHTIGARSNAFSEASLQPFQRKRKHNANGVLEQQQNTSALELTLLDNKSGAMPVKIAALEAIEALLTVGGALRSKSWGSSIDNLIMNIANNCCIGRWGNERSFLSDEHTSVHSDFQLAALRALLASLLSQSSTRPPHLAQSLQLFRRGRQETGTNISYFCAHALLALEVLVHPRALPLIDSHLKNSHDEVEENTMYRIDDILHQRWIDGTKENEGSPDNVERQTNMEETPCETLSTVHQSGEKTSVGNAEAEIRPGNDEMMVDVRQPNNEIAPGDRTSVGNAEAKKRSGNDAMMGVLGKPNNETAQLQDFASIGSAEDDDSVAPGDKSTELDYNRDVALASPKRAAAIGVDVESDNESIDSMPDIKDVDPDSD
ncbi:unnamed protein product [Linum tenue]|uniref:Pre-rRNA-processing protein RIX1 N-terminal domain-containing protein n=1 Tax=Linum tenue TaxID=586396 RepID=A0AAV0KF23_9ROSI|nr:unnamed protein product [Linum tenue]